MPSIWAQAQGLPVKKLNRHPAEGPGGLPVQSLQVISAGNLSLNAVQPGQADALAEDMNVSESNDIHYRQSKATGLPVLQQSFVDTLTAGTRKFTHIVNAKLERWVSEKDTVVAEDGTEQ